MDCPGAEELQELFKDMKKQVRRITKEEKRILAAQKAKEQLRSSPTTDAGNDDAQRTGSPSSGMEAMQRVMMRTPLEKKRSTARGNTVVRMRDCFGPTIIRRTRSSKDSNGQTINGLEERIEVGFEMRMSDKESKQFGAIIERTSAQL